MKDLIKFGREMSKFFDNFFDDNPFGSFFDEDLLYRKPVVRSSETDKELKIFYEIPGMNKEDIKLSVKDRYIEVNAEKKEESENKKSYSKFYRAMTLPYEVDSEKVNATYKNGVLEVILQKTEKDKLPKKTIEIE